MARLKEEYVRKARAKAAADAVGGRAGAASSDGDGSAGGASGWPTLEDTVRDFIGEVGYRHRFIAPLLRSLLSPCLP